MKKEKYHHGNLQVDLIEAGLTLIHEDGKANFSLRKLAKMLGVSPTACYNHFSSVEELLKAMKEYVTSKFCSALKEGAECKNDENSTISMGMAYVDFFAKNPHYFSFIYENDDYQIKLTDKDFTGDFEPLHIFKEASIEFMKQKDISNDKINDNLIVMWATVHGLSAMANMKGFHFEGDWKTLTKKILIDKINLC